MHRILVLFASLVLVSLVAGCQSSDSRNADPENPATLPSITLSDLAGVWLVDLSPAQDGSYLKELEIVPLPPAAASTTVTSFRGRTYGDSPYDNGLCLPIGDRLAISFVSDEAGEFGGPYYWIAVAEPASLSTPSGASTSRSAVGTDPVPSRPLRLVGRVQSLSRAFAMAWTAAPAPPPPPASPPPTTADDIPAG